MVEHLAWAFRMTMTTSPLAVACVSSSLSLPSRSSPSSSSGGLLGLGSGSFLDLVNAILVQPGERPS